MNVQSQPAVFLVALLVTANPPVFAAVPIEQRSVGIISGQALNALGRVMPDAPLRLRNAQTGQLAGSMRARMDGQFRFGALAPGMYVVEILNARGDVVSASAPIVVAATAMVVNDRKVLAAGVGQAVGAGGSFSAGTAGVIAQAAVAAGAVGVTVSVTRDNASPSR
jgi:hypothetical protein